MLEFCIHTDSAESHTVQYEFEMSSEDKFHFAIGKNISCGSIGALSRTEKREPDFPVLAIEKTNILVSSIIKLVLLEIATTLLCDAKIIPKLGFGSEAGLVGQITILSKIPQNNKLGTAIMNHHLFALA